MKHDTALRRLVLIPGDQLDKRSAAFGGFNPELDATWMAEVTHESRKVLVAKMRIAIFLAAMRHFCDALRKRGSRVCCRLLTERGGAHWSGLSGKGSFEESFAAQLAGTIAQTHPEKLIVVEPGEWGVREEIVAVAREAGVRQFIADVALHGGEGFWVILLHAERVFVRLLHCGTPGQRAREVLPMHAPGS
ncbi:MAG: cryptochrome/photolyase family protein [Verrucomicrobiales bacterium]